MKWLCLTFSAVLVHSATAMFRVCNNSPDCSTDPNGDCRLTNGCVFCVCPNTPANQPSQNLGYQQNSQNAGYPSNSQNAGYPSNSQNPGYPSNPPTGSMTNQGMTQSGMAHSGMTHQGMTHQGQSNAGYDGYRTSGLPGYPSNNKPMDTLNPINQPPHSFNSLLQGSLQGGHAHTKQYPGNPTVNYNPFMTNPLGAMAAAMNACPPVMCPLECLQTINVTDANGCRVCRCLCTGSTICPAPNSPQNPFSPQQQFCSDKHGCTQCACSLHNYCSEPICAQPCSYGSEYVTDIATGCAKCKCAAKPDCPRRPRCGEKECRYGFKKINGCISPTCECAARACPLLTCQAKDCPLGFARDTSGSACPTCECKRQESSSSTACTHLSCLKDTVCGNGQDNVKERGCPLCVCESVVFGGCPPVNCMGHNCPHGFKRVNHCDTCFCKAAPVYCPALQCNRRSCSKGFATTNPIGSGCPTCDCVSTRSSSRG